VVLRRTNGLGWYSIGRPVFSVAAADRGRLYGGAMTPIVSTLWVKSDHVPFHRLPRVPGPEQRVDRASVGTFDHDWDPIGITEFTQPSGEMGEPGGSVIQALGRATESALGLRLVPTTGPIQRPARKSVPE
jgi:hypothetical protein